MRGKRWPYLINSAAAQYVAKSRVGERHILFMCSTTSSEHSNLLGHSISNDIDKSHNVSCDGTRDDNSTKTKQQKQKSKWYIILLGQSIALSLSCANAASSRLENKYQIRIPTFQTGIVYIILSFHLIPLFWKERIKQQQHDNNTDACNDINLMSYGPKHSISCNDNQSQDMYQVESKRHYKFPLTKLSLHTPYTTYILLSILDIEANYLAMLSFQHTSLSSSMLFTSLSILSTVLLRQFVFKSVSYGTKRLIGVVLCLIGGCTWLWHEYYTDTAQLDTSFDGERETNSTINGDLLALAAASLYGLNDVAAEYFIKANNDSVEYLGMLGFFGSIFSFGIQVPLLEREEVWRLTSNGIGNQEAFLFICFVMLLSFFYISVMKFLSLYDATILNLSLQTCPLWAVALTKMQNSIDKGVGNELLPPVTFFISLALIMIGMVLYESNVVEERSEAVDNKNTEVI